MPDQSLAQRLMTLAGLAYGKPSNIPYYLQEDVLTRGDWDVYWMAEEVEDPVNFSFIAKSRTSRRYCVVIRGTYPNPFSPAYWEGANQDNPFGDMQPWPLGSGSAGHGAPMVSRGTADAFTNILALSDGSRTFRQAVAAIPLGSETSVTGHSLGGTLAPVIALWMNTLPNKFVPTVYGFAGLTPGNEPFAELFHSGTVPPDGIFRYKNTLDSVPYGWDDVLSTKDFYQPAPRGGPVAEAAVILLAFRLANYRYAPIGQEVALAGSLQKLDIPIESIAFVVENLMQHLPDTYLSLLGAPSLPFRIGFGAVVARGGATMAESFGARMPVVFA